MCKTYKLRRINILVRFILCQSMFYRTFTPKQNATEMYRYINAMYNLTADGEVKRLSLFNMPRVETQTVVGRDYKFCPTFMIYS